MIRLHHALLAAVLIQSASACQVPVFRYALERWEADPFRLQVIHREPLPPALEKVLLATDGELSATPPAANLTLEVLDVTRLNETQQLSVVGLEQVQRWPAFLLHPPTSWRGAAPRVLEASEQTLQHILHSPARQRCIDGLLAGESAVWFLIESGEARADQAAFELLQRSLGRAAKEIKIPEGVFRPEDVESAGGDVNLDDVLRSSIPLKISFTIERLRRDDPAEQVFLQLLTGPSGPMPDGPVIVPVFGRGRSPGPVSAAAVTEERIVQACAYLCGACSCQVKSGNPGYDLLFRVPWHQHLQDGLVVIERELPPLPGIGVLSQESRSPTLESKAIPAPDPAPTGGVPLWGLVGGALVLVLIAGSFFLTRSARS